MENRPHTQDGIQVLLFSDSAALARTLTLNLSIIGDVTWHLIDEQRLKAHRGKLEEYDVLIVSHVLELSEELQESVSAFVDHSGFDVPVLYITEEGGQLREDGFLHLEFPFTIDSLRWAVCELMGCGLTPESNPFLTSVSA